MNKLNPLKNYLSTLCFVFMMCIFIVSLTACQQESANPSSEKIKQLEDEVMNLKLESEKNTAALAEQKKDLEIIKEHLIPSYKAQITEETSSESSTTVTGDNSKASTPASAQPNNVTPAAPAAQPQKQPAPAAKVNVPPAGTPAKVNQSATNNTSKASSPAAKSVMPSSKPASPASVPAKASAPITPGSKTVTNNAMPVKNTMPAGVPKAPVQQPGKYVQPGKSTSSQTNMNSNVTNGNIKNTTYSNIVEADDNYGRSPKVVFSPYITKREYLGQLSISYSEASCKSKSDFMPPYCQDNAFNPDDPLTREELIAYAEYAIRGKPDHQLSQITPRFCKLYIGTFIDDADRVKLPYAKMIYRNLTKSDLINKVFHIFDNNILVFLPQRPVTKDQAMKCIKFIGEQKSSNQSA